MIDPNKELFGVDPIALPKIPSKERGCDGKIDISGKYTRRVESFAKKYGRPFGAYRCPHCNGVHLTSKLSPSKRRQYGLLLYISNNRPVD